MVMRSRYQGLCYHYYDTFSTDTCDTAMTTHCLYYNHGHILLVVCGHQSPADDRQSLLQQLLLVYRLVGLVVKVDPGFESRLRRDFFGVESYQWLKNWHSSDYPARRLAL